MPFIPAANTARVNFVMNYDNQIVENVCHFRILAPPITGVTLTGLANYCADWWVNSYSLAIAQAITLNSVVATQLDTDAGPQITVTRPGAAGQVAQESEPANVAYCITKFTASIGRSARGRWYVVGLPVTNVTLNNISVAAGDDLAGRVRSLFLAFPPPGWEAVVASYQHNGVVLPTATLYPVTSVVVRDYVLDSQRRRLPGRGI